MGGVFIQSVDYFIISCNMYMILIVVVQSLSRVQLSVTLWTAARQASLSFTISWSLLKHMSIKSMVPSNYLILCCPLLLLSSFESRGKRCRRITGCKSLTFLIFNFIMFHKYTKQKKDGRQEEKGATKDEMVGWHHQLNGHEFEQTPGDSEGPEALQPMGLQRV